MKRVPLLILGAGPTGLGAAMAAESAGADWRLLEAGAEAGGLAASFRDARGFTWDLGGHVQFSHYEGFDALMDRALGADGWLEHARESWIRLGQRWIPYPFQHHLHRLSAEDCGRCLAGLRAAAGGEAAHFGDWMDRQFGEGIVSLFLRPYNEKVWACDPSEMDAGWVGERVARPDVAAIEAAVARGEDPPRWGPNARFRFPRRGGTGAIWRAVAAMLPQERLHFGDAVSRVDVRARQVFCRSGRVVAYEHLISSLPLDLLIAMAPGVVPAAQAAAFRYTRTHVVGLGFRGQPPPELRKKSWMYFPGANSPYYRVTVFSNYSPENVPRPGEQWSLMSETAEGDGGSLNGEALVGRTLAALREDGLLRGDETVLTAVHRRLPRGYPVPFLGRDAHLLPVLEAFQVENVYSRGRFGAWKYEVSNQDHSYAQGKECVERILCGGDEGCEPTLHRPAWVNQRRNP